MPRGLKMGVNTGSRRSFLLDNFLPVSNLLILSKVIKQMITSHLQILEKIDYPDPIQSDFRPGSGTETFLGTLVGDLC